MRNLLTLIMILTFTSCASQFTKYKKTTDYNLMQCQKMCSSGNVIQIEKFNCACNLNNRRGDNQNRNQNYSSSHGNTVYINSPSRNPASNAIWGQALGQYLGQNERRLERNARILSAPVNNNNYINNTNIPSTPKIGTSQFSGW